MSEVDKSKRLQILERDGFCCYICNRKLFTGKYKDQPLPRLHRKHRATLDHYIPKCAGGTNDMENLRACCSKCNNRKGAKMPKAVKVGVA